MDRENWYPPEGCEISAELVNAHLEDTKCAEDAQTMDWDEYMKPRLDKRREGEYVRVPAGQPLRSDSRYCDV